MSMTLVKGSATAIPAELLSRHERDTYEWNKLEIGDHAEFFEENNFPKIRSSSISFGRGNKTRAPRAFATRQVDLMKDGKPVMSDDGKSVRQVLEVWRLPDPVIAANTPAVTPEPTPTKNGK